MAPEFSAAGSDKQSSYCRKQKSLGFLCTNFLKLYDRDGVDVIGLHDAAIKLGVERRRIYDIVNVLESIGVLTKKAMNQYSWRGFEAIPKAFEELKVEGLKENLNSIDLQNKDYVKVSDDDDDEEDSNSDSNPNTGSQNDNLVSGVKSIAAPRFDNRKEKSLGLLTQHFIKLFLCSDVSMISLEEAAKILLGDGHDSSLMRTKVRRLYDIANVLASMGLIEKTHTEHIRNRKPAFRWLGFRGRSQVDEVCGSSTLSQARKRTFGDDVTNICFTRDQMDSSLGSGENVNPKLQKQLKVGDSQNQCSKDYQFPSSTPASMQKVGDSTKQATHIHDLESLSSIHYPKYHNQAMRDLFDHYAEALRSWHTEVAGKKQPQIS